MFKSWDAFENDALFIAFVGLSGFSALDDLADAEDFLYRVLNYVVLTLKIINSLTDCPAHEFAIPTRDILLAISMKRATF